MFSKIRTFFLGKALANTENPFQNVRLEVLISFSLLFFTLNLPYFFIALRTSLILFSTAVLQSVTMVTVVLLLRQGRYVKLAIYLFIINLWFQNIFHFYANNGILLEQGILFYMVAILISFILLGRKGGYISAIIVATLVLLGIYNEIHDFALFKAPAEIMDPPMLKSDKYFIVIPFLLNVLLIGAFFRAQQRAEKQLNEQKNVISEKKKEITDGITYAARIQGALLPPLQQIDKTLERLKNNSDQ